MPTFIHSVLSKDDLSLNSVSITANCLDRLELSQHIRFTFLPQHGGVTLARVCLCLFVSKIIQELQADFYKTWELDRL